MTDTMIYVALMWCYVSGVLLAALLLDELDYERRFAFWKTVVGALFWPVTVLAALVLAACFWVIDSIRYAKSKRN